MKKLISVISIMGALFMANAENNMPKVGDGSAKKVLAVYITVDDGKVDEFLKMMKPLVEGSQKEEGCLEYTLYNFGKKNKFFLYEEYVDDAAFKKHQASEHFQSFKKTKEAIGGIEMKSKQYDVASVKSNMKK